MPLVLATLKGPVWFEPSELSPTSPFVFGRSEKAGWPIPEDTFLSGGHFRVESYAEKVDEERSVDRWKLVDEGSTNGTFVNGQRVSEAALKDGDTILAGQTTFRVTVTEGVPGRPLTTQERLIYLLGGQPSPLYAIVDASREPSIFQLLQGSTEPKRSFFQGPSAKRFNEFAPYLVQLTGKDTLLISLIYGGWGNAWGVYFTSKASFDQIYEHLRRYLLLADPSGNSNFFRFFDPRVLRKFLPRSKPDKLGDFFGPVEAWLAEGEDAGVAVKYASGDEGLEVKEIAVGAPVQPGSVPR